MNLFLLLPHVRLGSNGRGIQLWCGAICLSGQNCSVFNVFTLADVSVSVIFMASHSGQTANGRTKETLFKMSQLPCFKVNEGECIMSFGSHDCKVQKPENVFVGNCRGFLSVAEVSGGISLASCHFWGEIDGSLFTESLHFKCSFSVLLNCSRSDNLNSIWLAGQSKPHF